MPTPSWPILASDHLKKYIVEEAILGAKSWEGGINSTASVVKCYDYLGNFISTGSLAVSGTTFGTDPLTGASTAQLHFQVSLFAYGSVANPTIWTMARLYSANGGQFRYDIPLGLALRFTNPSGETKVASFTATVAQVGAYLGDI